jgi:hypothetical protein
VRIAAISEDLKTAEKHICEHFVLSFKKCFCQGQPTYYFENPIITEDYNLLKDTQLVIQIVIERCDN